MIDCAFRTQEGRFYYCVRALIIRNGKLLVMKDENSPHYYLVGGKVAMEETAEQALLREVKEELGIDAEIVRVLWFCENFFTEKVRNESYHELGLYYLLQMKDNDLTEDEFDVTEGKHTLKFKWLPFETLEKEFIYPTFIKQKIYHLPEHLEMIVAKE